MSQNDRKITIVPSDLDLSPKSRLSEPWNVPTSEPDPRTPIVEIVLHSSIPFWNAWWWFRRSRHQTSRRRFSVIVAAVLFAVSVGVLVVGASMFLRSDRHWVESICESIDRSVVKVLSGNTEGTGFVIASQNGRHLILTNNHVVTNTKVSLDRPVVTIRSKAGNVYTGAVVGFAKDPDVDLALCVIEASELSPLGAIRSFRDVRVGEKVVAIGHPLGLDFSVTDGIVSGKRGALLIQTSAPISPGNSGGPLVDVEGRIIGVNTCFVNAQKGQLLSFAIRADLVLERHEWNYLRDISSLLEQVAK